MFIHFLNKFTKTYYCEPENVELNLKPVYLMALIFFNFKFETLQQNKKYTYLYTNFLNK